jgi:Kef-type K+ transport system membrane component KefB
MGNVFLEFAAVLTLASVLGFLVHKFNLPLIIAYLAAGIFLSLVSVFDVNYFSILHELPEVGIAFVLFLIGMELDLREIKSLGLPIVVAALGQITLTTLAIFFISTKLGFSTIESIYLGLGLAFSSTVVVIKLLLEKKDLNSLYGKLSIGILLIEDLVAVVVLMAISVGSSALGLGYQASLPILTLLLKMFGLFILTFVLSRFVLERIFDSIAKSVELLFLTAITWCFAFTSLAVISGFSVVIGAFLAGVALASSPYHIQIQGKIKPLRDFFLMLFFVFLGTQVNLSDLTSLWPIILIFTLFAILVKPLIYAGILGMFGFRKHTIYQTSLNLSQISEFSLILLLVGVQYKIVSPSSLSVMATVAVSSILFSSALIASSKKLFKYVSPLVSIFERKSKHHSFESKFEDEFSDHIVIVGADRIGGPIVKYLKKTSIPFLVMDFNPTIVKKLQGEGINVIYGDVGDPEVIDSLQIEKAKLIISTASDRPDNETFIKECKRRKSGATLIVRADDAVHAENLKKLGADYCLIPEKVSASFIVHQLKSQWPRQKFSGLK